MAHRITFVRESYTNFWQESCTSLMSKRVGGGAAKRAGIPLAGQDVVERIGVVGKGGSIEVGVVNGVDTPLKGAEKEGKAEEKRD